MSTISSTGTDRTTDERLVETVPDVDPFRLLALGGVVVLTVSYVSVLQDVTAVVGGTRTLLALVVLMFAAATLLARTISVRTATITALAAATFGFAYYLSVVGLGVGIVFTATWKIVSDTIALATGLSLLRMVEAGVWTLGFAPGPVFLSWYLALRRRYVPSVLAGGVALLFLVLTGDSLVGPTLVGTVGGIAAVGFGELERRQGSVMQADTIAVLVAIMILISTLVPLVPSTASGPTILMEGGGTGTLEGTLTSSPDRSAIGGPVDLSPEVRFTVRSQEPSYWRVGIYDRFTGDSWYRTGQDRPYGSMNSIPDPPGESESVSQTVYVEDRLEVMPAAPQPVDVEGGATENTLVSTHGQIRPDEPLIEGDVYNVESAVLDVRPERLRSAGTQYPDAIEDTYLQLPESTSSEFREYTSDVVAGENTPYDKAAAIEAHLRESKEYSLDVSRPNGNVANEFVFRMDEGYCVYFATTMVQMLRSEDIPARYVVGYTTGQQVSENEWVVRGLNAHAWVEVYFPEHGWVTFDPTPSGPREETNTERIEQARQDGEDGVDTDLSSGIPIDQDSFGDPPENTNDSNDTSGTEDPGTIGPPDSNIPGSDTNDPLDRNTSINGTGTDEPGEPGDGPSLPSGEDAFLGLAVFVGLVAGAHRTGAGARAGREVRLRWQGLRGDPEDDVERAFRRLELLLARRYRARKPSEPPRQYLTSLSSYGTLDERARTVARRYEQSKYGGGVSRREADEAVRTVDEMVQEATPLIGRFRGYFVRD